MQRKLKAPVKQTVNIKGHGPHDVNNNLKSTYFRTRSQSDRLTGDPTMY